MVVCGGWVVCTVVCGGAVVVVWVASALWPGWRVAGADVETGAAGDGDAEAEAEAGRAGEGDEEADGCGGTVRRALTATPFGSVVTVTGFFVRSSRGQSSAS